MLNRGVAMRRRYFIQGIIGSAITGPLAARAQQSMPVMGFLSGCRPDHSRKESLHSTEA
jgi:hypothetical protein